MDGYVMAAIFLGVGLALLTPQGAAYAARVNRRTGGSGMGYAPTTARAARLCGVAIFAGGIAIVVSMVT